MMKRSLFFSVVMAVFFIFSGDIHPVMARAGQKKSAPDKERKSFQPGQRKNPERLTLTLQKVVDLLVRQNYDFRKALLAFRGSSSDLLMYNSKYNTYMFGKADYSNEDNPNSQTSAFMGSNTKRGSYSLGLQKSFSTGTTLQAGIGGFMQTINGSQYSDGRGYQNGINVTLTQELLKNSFGLTDRMVKKQLRNVTRMKRQAIKMQLAGLVLQAIVDDWNIAIAEENLKTGRISLTSTRNIRNLIARKLRLGLSENEELLDWNGKVLASKNMVELSGKSLFDARLAVLRTLNLPSDNSNIEISASFEKTPPNVNLEQALRDAFIRRIDWSNQKIIKRNAELNYRVAMNQTYPSLKLKLGASTLDYSQKTFSRSLNGFGANMNYSAGLEFSYPLENTAAKVKLRDARLILQREELNQKSMEKEIRDETRSIIKQCAVSYRVYTQTRDAMEYSRRYYTQVMIKFRRGRYSAIQLKLALDSYIRARYSALQSLIGYNIALIRRDLGRNVIFEKYHLDVDLLLKRVAD